jgi:quercetin dioxygenase-like cupin family protein
MSEKSQGARLEGAKPISLSAMVQYQEGAVVSRILYQDDIGTLTVFAFDEGQALSEHTVPFDAFVNVLDGFAEITIGGTACRVGPGEIVRMPGGIPHKVDAPERFKMLLTLFRTKRS